MISSRNLFGEVSKWLTIDTHLECRSVCFIFIRSLKQEGAPCLNYTYQSMLDDLLKTEFDASEQPGGRQWTYQTCSEFGWYQTSDQPKHPYGSRFPLKDSIKVCL